MTVNRQEAYTKVQLLLNPNGTWQIFSASPETTAINISGRWQGRAYSDNYPGCYSSITGILTQQGQQLTGQGTLEGNCLEGGSGQINGSIEGNVITLGAALDTDTMIQFTGTLSNDSQTLTGTY